MPPECNIHKYNQGHFGLFGCLTPLYHLGHHIETA